MKKENLYSGQFFIYIPQSLSYCIFSYFVAVFNFSVIQPPTMVINAPSPILRHYQPHLPTQLPSVTRSSCEIMVASIILRLTGHTAFSVQVNNLELQLQCRRWCKGQLSKNGWHWIAIFSFRCQIRIKFFLLCLRPWDVEKLCCLSGTVQTQHIP